MFQMIKMLWIIFQPKKNSWVRLVKRVANVYGNKKIGRWIRFLSQPRIIKYRGILDCKVMDTNVYPLYIL